jgi:capsular exopolysaccharide synthesis family protein
MEQLKRKSFVVGSCLPNEGKSTGALNLGYSLSATGIKVLVVETDMRRPTFNNYGEFIGLKDIGSKSVENGLSQLLDPRTQNLNLSRIRKAIVQTNIENFDLLPCRSVPSNPTELIEGARMPYLIQSLEKEYDIVIYDSPPTLSVVDSLVLARLVKNVFLIVHAGHTSKRSFMSAKLAFQEVGVNIVGAVLNKIPRHKLGDEYGYSYSNYNYFRYSYGYNSETNNTNLNFNLSNFNRSLSTLKSIVNIRAKAFKKSNKKDNKNSYIFSYKNFLRNKHKVVNSSNFAENEILKIMDKLKK